ncbi:LOW QUALITY PROTEIN: kielin/chordin-like protein [Pollicipes pollicipes]|uniref:LOW QUALITY PROTEIN: kielin/chordin-like protein n=1 Tax=Pollicipes pollicipes TaxID=41117 RepID=UPI001884EE4C|nr:LOW QUALITY PROTEIN: kielin/chordin-like protein [Pollicipes pollicipes]
MICPDVHARPAVGSTKCDNTCFCPDSGHSACTLMSCPPGKRPMVPVRYIYADGDACTDEGSSWRHDCNMCRCLDGLVVCSSRPCRQQLLRAPLLAGSEPDSDKQCEEDKEWTDECDNNCRCSNGGLVMCTLKVCAPGKQAGRPLKVLPRLGEPCEDGSGTWHDDCNACQCVDGVTACTRGACRQRQQERDGVPVQQCRPGSSWLDECDNICSCSPNGVSYCTLKACPYGRQYGVPTKFVSAVNDTCTEEGATWRQDCNTCSCTEGRVNCTEDICQETGVSARFGPPGIRCLPGSKWTDQCENTCRCTSSGQAACSLKACPPGKKAGERVEDIPKAGDACDAEGRTWKEDCTRCTCTEGRVQCTEQICTPMDLPIRDEGPCTEDEEWIDECTNRCKCIGGEPRCTRRPCPEGGRPGVPVRFVVPDGDTCDNDGEQWKDDCNTCRCQGGRVSCTKKACVGFERGGGNKKPGECPYVPPGTLGFCFNGCNGDDMCPDDEKCCSNGCGALCMKPDTCLEGIAWEEDCNTCACINGEPACTKKLCAKEQPQSDAPVPQANERATCLEGSVWKKDCNTCDCVGGRPLCTKMLCPSKISFIDEVTGECREDSVWRKDCNRCRCIGGRAVCTLKQCGPGKPSNKGGAKELAVCELPPIEPDSDPCNGFIRRWTYDAAAGKCRRYIYGGCGGTRNLFRTRKQCRKRCAAGGAQSSRAAACRLPVKSGPCFDVMPRYYFDTAADKCRQFGFSGCGGNENNFRSLTKCIQACGGTYTSDDNQCDRRRCPWSLYKNNLDKGCEPVYENQACCPTRFDCPDVRDAGSDDACTYRGKRYAAGERVPAASRLDPCKRDCVCASNPGSGPQIDCAEFDCPAAVWNQISAGCLPLYLPDRCCPVDVQCGSRRRRSTDISLSSQGHTCQADGLTYVEGELMPTRDDPCVTCVCTTEYEGPGGPGCRFNDCLDQNSRRANSECVPVYMTDVCCPVDWKCPEDVAYRALSETSELLEISQVEPSCLLPKNRGPCSRTLERFFFDTEQQRCVPFVFSGCEANENNFKSLADCNAACDRRKSGAASLGGNLVSLASVSGGACLLPTSAGSCSERLIRFSYDSTSGACTSFEYGGCGGNANNFVSLEQCKNTCVPTDSQDFCLLPPTSGSCDSVLLRYFFHAESGVCESFTFGGCDGNANNFLTEEECYNKCQPGSMETKRRLQKVASTCLSRPDPGPCRFFQQRYFFSSETARCHPFRGCMGNGNNFASYEECSQECGVLVQYLPDAGAKSTCAFGTQNVPRGTWIDVQDKCTICECLTPPKLTCRKLHCPQIVPGLEELCEYRLRDPGACCPELVCDAAAPELPNLGPECSLELCHLSSVRPGCSTIYRSGECCPEIECLHPEPQQDPEEAYVCELLECPSSCLTSRDQYGCVQCDCQADSQAAAIPCERQFCPVGCASHYEHGCIVCECDSPSTPPPPATTRPPCPAVTCRPGCGYKRDGRGCSVCDCPPRRRTPAACPPAVACPAECRETVKRRLPILRLRPGGPGRPGAAELAPLPAAVLPTALRADRLGRRCQCDLCPPCDCPAARSRCPTAVCPAHCPRAFKDGCHYCACDGAVPLSMDVSRLG